MAPSKVRTSSFDMVIGWLRRISAVDLMLGDESREMMRALRRGSGGGGEEEWRLFRRGGALVEDVWFCCGIDVNTAHVRCR